VNIIYRKNDIVERENPFVGTS